MQKIRILGASIALGGVALLTGCVGVPGDPYYDGGYSSGGYGDPYYGSSPVVVQPAPVYIQGGGYYEGRRPYYNRPYYGGRPGYPGVRPGYPAVRPGAGGPRPGWGGGGRPPGGGVIVPPTGNTGVSPLPQYRPQAPRGNSRLWTSPDSKNSNDRP
ncbi:hypothetical protein [Variovorax boronicumulans]|uniref:hypothetical protein n=1 Tax=Variovorax boronicumulans TaxID=436515 RepID=UPI003399E847